MFACLSIGVFSSLLTIRASYHIMVLSKLAASQAALKTSNANGYVMGINDIYLISCIIILLALPISILLKRKKG